MMDKKWYLTIMWMSMVWPSSDGLENNAGDYTGYGSLVRVRRKAADSTQLWPDAMVPYTFLEPEPSRSIVLSGLSHWEKYTCIRFSPVNNTDFPHLQFRKLSGCRSGVGIEGTSGQNISIGDNCNKLGIVVHEIGHALGFYHEIRRPDRDDQVVINEENILKDELFNFYKLHWLDISIKYDLSSVMHYNPLEWSSNERTTVATKDPMLQGIIGRWKQESKLGLSHRDKLLANTIYGCLDRWLEKCNLNRNPCKNEGYLGETCTCVCAPGTTGRTCETSIGGYYDDLTSSCSREVTYPTYITSPNYPHNYDKDTWCVYRLKGQECQAPEIVIWDFQLGPRGFRDQCFHDYLEVRNNSLYNGFIKCGTDVTRGTRWVASGSTMILYFKGSEGGYRGFKAKVEFNPIPGCCRTHTNSSAYFLHTPGYPHPYSRDFNCTYGLTADAPARVVVTVIRKGGSRTDGNWTCALQLCQPHGRCYRHCADASEDTSWGDVPKEVILPNVASIHHMQYSGDYSPFRQENAAFQVGFTLEDSPCHRIIIVNRTEPRGWITVGPRFFELLQCEWWLQAPRGSHVKITISELHLPVHVDSYLAINEAGEATYPRETTRVYHDFEDTPKTFVSLEYKLAIVLQGDFITEVSLKYELYDCVDMDEECEYWAANDECEKNPYWMKKYCKKSCLLCEYTATCQDEHPECEFWATHEQCEDNRVWMNVHCKKSCGYCDRCWDANPQCSDWADKGECEGNPNYMNHFCRKSCGLCGDFETASTTVKPTGKVGKTTSPRTPPISTTTNQSRETNRPSKPRTINQTFKPNKNKYKRYRNNLTKPSKDRFNQYKHNNVMLPPHDEDDDDDEDGENYSTNQIHKGFKKEKNLMRPFDTGRISKPFKQGRISDVPKKPHKPRLYKSRTSSPNTRIGTSRNIKRRQKNIEATPRKPKIRPTGRRKPQIGEDIAKPIALPLVREQNESESNTTQRVTVNTLSSEDINETKIGEDGDNSEMLIADLNLMQNMSTETCQEGDIANCNDSQKENQNLPSHTLNNTANPILGSNNTISQGNSRKIKLTNMSSKRMRKRGKTHANKRNKNRNEKRRRKKNKTSRKLTYPESSRRNDTERPHLQNARHHSKHSENLKKKKKNVFGRNGRRRNKHRGKGRNKTGGPRKHHRRLRNRTRGNSYRRRPGEIIQTSTALPIDVDMADPSVTSTTMATNQLLKPETPTTTHTPVTTSLQPTETSYPSTTNTDSVDDSIATTESESYLVVLTTEDEPFVTVTTTSTTQIPSIYGNTTTTTVAMTTTQTDIIRSIVTSPPNEESFNISKSNRESNTINLGLLANTTSEEKDKKKRLPNRLRTNRRKNARKQKRRHKQRKLNRRILNQRNRVKGKRNQLSSQQPLLNHKKNRPRNVHEKTNSPHMKESRSRWYKRWKKHRTRFNRRHNATRSGHASRTSKESATHKSAVNYDVTFPDSETDISSIQGVDVYSQELLTTASPPAPSSTSSVPSPEDLMLMKTSETQTEMSIQLHTMLQTEPETESPLSEQSMESLEDKMGAQVPTDDKTQLEEEPEKDQMDGPPQRFPEKYAEWGIGPLKSPHHSARRPRPKWKYRRSFYRRDHIYEDIWPLFDESRYGGKR